MSNGPDLFLKDAIGQQVGYIRLVFRAITEMLFQLVDRIFQSFFLELSILFFIHLFQLGCLMSKLSVFFFNQSCCVLFYSVPFYLAIGQSMVASRLLQP